MGNMFDGGAFGGGAATPTVRTFIGNADSLSPSTYAGLKAWRFETDGRGLWCLAPQALGAAVIQTIANAKSTSPAGRTRTNDSLVTASDLGVTDPSGLTVSIDTASTYDYSTSVKTAPYQTITQPNFGRWRANSRVVCRVKCSGASTGTYLFGLIVINSANANSYLRLTVGSISSAATGYSEYGTTSALFTVSNAQIAAGVWLRIIFNYDGSVTSQWSTSTATTEAAVTGWTTQQTSGAGLMPFNGSVLVGMLQLRAATGTPSPLTCDYVYYDDSTSVSEAFDVAEPMGLGAVSTRANAASPVVLVDTGKSTSVCSSIADVQASITAACNRRPYDTATLRFNYKTYATVAAVSAPADGDSGWVALASISSLAAPSAGAVHVLWVDAGSTSGAQSASIDLGAIRLPVSA